MIFFKSHWNEDLRREIIPAQANEQWAFLTLKLTLKNENILQKELSHIDKETYPSPDKFLQPQMVW